MTWSSTEVGVLARAVSRAPSVHNSQPWALEAHVDSADLYERFQVRLPRHDPTGRDRVISCGAALTNLELAVRALGWDAEVSLFPDSARPDLVARVRASGRSEATAGEVDRYSAIFRRQSYRAPFSLHQLSEESLRTLATAARTDGTEARVIRRRSESRALAELLGHAAAVLHDDHAYQRELTAWSAQFPDPPEEASTLPWTGLVRSGTHLPDSITLTERLMGEGLLVVLTPDDTRRDHLRAGAALQRVWLTAITRGLVGSVLTQPLHLAEIRTGLVERLQLAGYPQLFLRLGYPVTAIPATTPIPALGKESHR